MATPAGYVASPQNQTTEDKDSDNPAGEPALATKGTVNNDYDFGFALVADLSVTKSDGVTSVNAGGSTTYTIRVTNKRGRRAADGGDSERPGGGGVEQDGGGLLADAGAVRDAGRR